MARKPVLPWYCIHCSMEFYSQEALWLHKCEELNSDYGDISEDET